MDANQELEQFKKLVTKWLTIHLNVLEANITTEEDLSQIKQTEKDLGQETLNILHRYQIETANLESAVRDIRNAARGENLEDLDAVMPRFKQEMSRILYNQPVIEPLVQNLRDYYRAIFSNPELARQNQTLYERCLNVLLHPNWVNTNPVYVQDLQRLFKEFLQCFLAEERRLNPEESTSTDSSTSYETIESSSDDDEKKEDNDEKSVSFDDSKNEVIPDNE